VPELRWSDTMTWRDNDSNTTARITYVRVPVGDPTPVQQCVCCPVCWGCGQVPLGFYRAGRAERYESSASITTEPCRTCGGSGVLWR
jgi:hypothetical protein